LALRSPSSPLVVLLLSQICGPASSRAQSSARGCTWCSVIARKRRRETWWQPVVWLVCRGQNHHSTSHFVLPAPGRTRVVTAASPPGTGTSPASLFMEGPPPCHGEGGAGWLLLSLFSSSLSQPPALSLPQTLAAAAGFSPHPLRFGRVLRIKLCQLRQSAPELLVEDDGQKKT
jgi:hypothetical protein